MSDIKPVFRFYVKEGRTGNEEAPYIYPGCRDGHCSGR